MSLWSYVLAAVGIFGLWLVGRDSRKGWAVSVFTQLLWIVYAIATKQWGFIFSALGYGWVCGKHYQACSSESKKEAVA